MGGGLTITACLGYAVNGGQAFLLVVLASAWKQVSYNFIFFLAGLQSIPRAVIEAARLDAQGLATLSHHHRPAARAHHLLSDRRERDLRRVRYVRDDLGAHQGGPAEATDTLVVKVYRDGVVNLDLGGSSAQSVLLMIGVIIVTAIQFRFIGRKAPA